MDASEKPTASQYYVGWLCALPSPERVAAEAVLDQRYDYETPPARPGRSGYAYTYGRMGRYNIVIACLSRGDTGNIESARLLGEMRQQFSNMKYFLLVGIAGGMPGDIDQKDPIKNIHLGDVVVASRRKNCPGVVSYTQVDATPTGLVDIAALDKPVQNLRQAAGLLETKINLQDATHTLGLNWEELEKHPILKKPELEDVLYLPDYKHTEGDTCEYCDDRKQVSRPLRTSGGTPVIHFGPILSGVLIKDGVRRDRLGQQYPEALCCEMEAAGLDDSHCLVVRGISDYADSHKNKDWQGFAPAGAAIVAKKILSLAQLDEPEEQGPKQIPRGHPAYNQHELAIPFDFQKGFRGRDEIISQLQKTLIEGEKIGSTKVFVLWGQAGCGKTAICNYFYSKNATQYWAAWRINAETVVSIEEDFERIASQNFLPKGSNDSAQTIRRVCIWLSNQKKHWLLIFENADDENISLQEYIPNSSFGTALITTRHKQHADMNTVGDYEVQALDENNSVSLLLNIVKYVPRDPQSKEHALVQAAAKKVVEKVCHLPMAIVIAGSTIRHDRHSTRTMDIRLQDWLLGFDERPHPKHRALKLWATYDNAIQSLLCTAGKEGKQRVDDAIELLYFFSFLSSNSISLNIFEAILSRRVRLGHYHHLLSSPWSEQISDKKSGSPLDTYSLAVLDNRTSSVLAPMERIEEAISLLDDICLLTITPRSATTQGSMLLHSLVRECARISRFYPSEEDGQRYAVTAIVTLAQAIVREYTTEDRAFRRSLLPHIEACKVACAGEGSGLMDVVFEKLGFRDGAEVILRISLVYSECGKIEVARQFQQRVVSMATEKMDSTDELLLWARAMLATSCHDLNGPGQRQDAVELRELVLQIRETNLRSNKTMGDEGVEEAYLIALSNLADSYDQIPSRYGDAIKFREAILRHRQGRLQSADLIETKLRLARSYAQGGQRQKSHDLRLEIYSVDRQQLKDRRPEDLDELDLIILSDLADSYCDRGEWNQALRMRRIVWERRRTLLQDDHPDTLAAKANVALSLTKLGEIPEAIKLRGEIFNSQKIAFGPYHPITLKCYLELAKTLAKADGGKEDAKRIRMHCLEIWQYKSTHSKEDFSRELLEAKMAVARSLEESIRRSEDSEDYFNQAMQLREEILSPLEGSPVSHVLQIAKAMNDKAECYAFYRKYEDARTVRQELLARFAGLFQPSSEVSFRRMYVKILNGLARDSEQLANDYRQNSGHGSALQQSIDIGSHKSCAAIEKSSDIISSFNSSTRTREGVIFDAQIQAQSEEFLKEAIQWREEILKIHREWSEDELDAETAKAMTDLARCYARNDVGRKGESIELYQCALKFLEREDRLGENHETTRRLRGLLEDLRPEMYINEWLDGVLASEPEEPT